MSYSVNTCVAPFCHSQDHSGGVPVAPSGVSAGLALESSHVQVKPLVSRYNESHAAMPKMPSRQRASRVLQGAQAVQTMRKCLLSAVPPSQPGCHPCTATQASRRESGEGESRAGEMARGAYGVESVLQTEDDVRANWRGFRCLAAGAERCMRYLPEASDRKASTLCGSRSFVLLRARWLRQVRSRPTVRPLQPRAWGVPRQSRTSLRRSGLHQAALQDIARGYFETSSRNSSPEFRRSGRTATSSRQSAARHWRSSSNMSKISGTCSRPYLPTPKGGGFSGGSR
jgi:hypothetical protein